MKYEIENRGSVFAMIGMLQVKVAQDKIAKKILKVLEEAFDKESLNVGAIVKIDDKKYLCLNNGWRKMV